jgi:ferrous iron transport protein B
MMAETKEANVKEIVVALAGNPNAGKTSLFNRLTGLRAHVGNYPGVTVEKKWGVFRHGNYDIRLVDLPGTYSLKSYSLDERVARNFILNERPDVVVDVADSTNLERNLFLTLQLVQLGIPTVLVLNMMDLFEAKGDKIDLAGLAKGLGVGVIPVVATKGKGIDELLDKVVEVYENPDAVPNPPKIDYREEVNQAADAIAKIIDEKWPREERSRAGSLWVALRYLETDAQVEELVDERRELAEILRPMRKKLAEHVMKTLNDELDGLITDQMYGYLSGLMKRVLTLGRHSKTDLSERFDSVILNRLLAPIIFILVIFGLYQMTFWISTPMVDALEWTFGKIGGALDGIMSDGFFKDLILEGIIGGVGGVMGFAPLIFFMFIGISIMEDTGYMARGAFILDRIFRFFGMHGNSAVALIVGGGIAGGCAIPGIMATRTLRDPKERIATVLVTPFMPCGAKMPVYIMLVGAFFDRYEAVVMIGVTVFGWAIAMISARLVRTFIIPGEPAPFVLELPPYRLPTLSGVLLHAWERTWGYIKKAGTLIVTVTIIIWVMMTFPALPEDEAKTYTDQIVALEAQAEDARDELVKQAVASRIDEIDGALKTEAMRHSVAGRIGVSLESVSRYIGFDWRTNLALVGGFAAKEVILSTLGTVYAKVGVTVESDEESDEEEVVSRKLAASLSVDPAWSRLTALTLMAFILIYAPCFATVVIIAREVGYRWAVFSLLGSTVWGFVIAFALFQGGRLLGF